MSKNYVELENLEVYRLARGASRAGWEIYKNFNWHQQNIIGDQFIRSLDSVGANLAEGYGRFHFLDKIKFYYNARGSLLEVIHWLNLMRERDLVGEKPANDLESKLKDLHFKLNRLIKSTFKVKEKNKLRSKA
ncbi:MAG: hypothetical protein B6D58_08780 [candidate division Zixibacteria bacterium 4484_95]|nr:MAG: hypothetical protein B6D58_08780 [candidate division Zixibacteria bacterium 4484_95]